MLSNLPIPLRAQLLALAALRMGKLRLAIFNPDEARDEHGRWISEGGFSSSPSDALVELGNGDKATVTKEDVRATVEKAYEQGIGPIDLTNLSVEGTPLFVGGLNRARDTMPQIPKEHQEAFLASMREKNISVTEALLNPTTLLPTQNEIDAVRVGEKLHKYDEEKKTMRPIMVSKDNYVLDGHHRWATATIVAFDSPKAGVKIPVIRIGAKHEKALDLMLDYTKAHKISNRALASRPESAIHAAADKHQNAMTVAVMYAFLKGRKVLKASLRTAGDKLGHEFHGNQWKAGGTSATHVKEVLDRMPRVAKEDVSKENRGEYKTGEISVAKVMGYDRAAKHEPDAKRGEKVTFDSKTRSIPIADLIPTQSLGVTSKIVGSYFYKDSPDSKIPIDVYERDGKHYIEDGHHRVVAAIVRGDKTIRANVKHFRSAEARSASTLDISACVAAIHAALLVSLPPVLLKVVAAGGEVGLARLKTRRAAGSPDQPRDEHGRWVGGAGSIISRSSSAENTAAFHAAVDALPPKVKEEIKNTIIQLVPSVEAFGHSHSAGVVEGAQNAEGILIKEGPRQTTSLYHEIGHKTSNLLADRQPFKDAVAKDTAKRLTGQMAYFASSPREAIAQSFAYHMGAKDSDRAKFEKTFKHTHNLLGEHLRKFGRLPTVASFHALLTSTTTAEERALAGPFDIRFDVSSPEAIAWARDHAGELAKDLSATSEQAIKDAVAAALEGDGVDAAYDDILDAIGDEARAEMIARTEVMTAANEGQRESWDQARDAGLLPDDAKREWIATSEACPECDDLDGEVVGLDEEYPNDGGDGPPLHPNCRCTEGISA